MRAHRDWATFAVVRWVIAFGGLATISACGRLHFDAVGDAGDCAGPAFVQSAQASLSACTTALVTSCSAAFDLPNRAGDLLRADVVAVGAPSSAITDSVGNSWTRAASVMRPDNGVIIESWYAMGAGVGANTVTVTFAAPGQTPKFLIYEDRGIGDSAPQVTTNTDATAYPPGDASPRIAIATSVAPALLTAAIDVGPTGNTTNPNAGVGWDLRETGPHGAGEEQVVTVAGSYSGVFDIGTAPQPWATIGVAYPGACAR